MIKKSIDINKIPPAAYKLFFSSLANANRLKIVNTLKLGKKCVQEICAETGLEQTLVSHNLRRLEHCGMVFPERKGKHCYYQVNDATIKPLLALIDKHMNEYCCKIIRGER
ncbi:winged helix-turn-helix transcriptional regulator [Candidatus Woesearchaeota archaeon]|nr:winged helix-turn-helix transcriptional regulator [Candidatus Woesearchaeota archaeon]